MQRPLIPLLFFLGAGIVVGRRFAALETASWLFLLALLVTLLYARSKGKQMAVFVLLSTAFLPVGMLNLNLYRPLQDAICPIADLAGSEKKTIEGVICEAPQLSPESTHIVLDVRAVIHSRNCQCACGRVMLTLGTPVRHLGYGDCIRFRSVLRRPRNFGNPGAFDYVGSLRDRGIYVRTFLPDANGIVLIRTGQGHPLKAPVESYRTRLKSFIYAHAPSPQAEIIQAMILGDQNEIPLSVREAFNKTGTTHILAISGFNIGIIAFVCILLVKMFMKAFPWLLLRFDVKTVSVLLAVIPVCLFTLVAGAGMSVIRATLMVLTFMTAILLGKERDLYNVLALAALVILLFHPAGLFDVSFQLSFAAVAALLFLTPRLAALLPKPTADGAHGHWNQGWVPRIISRWMHGAILFIFATLSATLGTLPFIVLYFNRISTVTLFANILVMPILGILVIPISMALIFTVPWLPLISLGLLRLDALLVGLSVNIIERFVSLSLASIDVCTPGIADMIFYYAVLILAGLLLPKPRRPEVDPAQEPSRPVSRWVLAAVLIVLSIVWAAATVHDRFVANHSDRLSIVAIDVGQGSATLVRLPREKTMLIDGGGFRESAFDVGKSVLAPVLWHEGLRRIDICVLTHPHHDHLQGLIFILSHFVIGEVWIADGPEPASDLYRDFLRVIRERHISVVRISARTPTRDVNGVLISCLSPTTDHPEPSLFEDDDTANDRSLVLKLVYGRTSFLLPADISDRIESRLVAKNAELRSNVLFVPHHGGRHSSSEQFLRHVAPESAVVSCGWENRFHNPHPDVLNRFARLGIRLYRTDLDGAIRMVSDGRRIQTDVAMRPSKLSAH